MGDKATEKNKQNDKTIGDGDKLLVSSRVSPAVRRFIHLGCSFDPYRSQKYHARGIVSVEPFDFNYRKAYSLEIFSEQMTKDFYRKNNEKDDDSLSGKTPKDGWPSPSTIEIIQKVIKENEGTSRTAALFILAACCRAQGPARNAAYAYAKVIDDAEDLLLFVKFAMDLTPKRKGWGSGLRRALKSWYLDRCGEMELAEQLTCYKQRHCWSHKDVLKQIHAKAKNKVQEILLAYTLFGVKKAQEILKTIAEDDPRRDDAEKMMAYLEAANELRKLRIPKGSDSNRPQVEKAVKLIKIHKFHFEHCDDTMHMEPLVWEALLENMPFWQVLVYLPKLRFHRIIKPGEEINKVTLNCLKHLNDALTKDSSTPFSPISPALVLISMQSYRRISYEDVPSKLWVSTKDGVVAVRNSSHGKTGTSNPSVGTSTKDQKKSNKSEGSTDAVTTGISNLHFDKGKRLKELPKLNPKIIEMLNKILVASIKVMQPTGKRFVFGAGNFKEKNGCLVNGHVMTNEAAALLFMCLEAVEADGTVDGYCINDDGSSLKRLRSPGYSIANCSREMMQGIGSTPINVDGFLAWLCRQKIAADVIVLVAEGVVSGDESGSKLLEALKKYRKDLKLPKAKLVLVSLVSKLLPHIEAQKFDYGILMTYGFDAQLPFIIQRFASGDF